MRTTIIFALFATLIAIAVAYPASEVEANNEALYDVNAPAIEHESAPRQARQFGFGRYGGYGGYGGGFGRFGGFGGGYGGFGGGFGRYGGYGGYGGYYG